MSEINEGVPILTGLTASFQSLETLGKAISLDAEELMRPTPFERTFGGLVQPVKRAAWFLLPQLQQLPLEEKGVISVRSNATITPLRQTQIHYDILEANERKSCDTLLEHSPEIDLSTDAAQVMTQLTARLHRTVAVWTTEIHLFAKEPTGRRFRIDLTDNKESSLTILGTLTPQHSQNKK